MKNQQPPASRNSQASGPLKCLRVKNDHVRIDITIRLKFVKKPFDIIRISVFKKMTFE